MDERTKQEIRDAKIRVLNNGGVINNKNRTIKPPARPGLKVLAALDCLVNYGGYVLIPPDDWILRRLANENTNMEKR